MSSQWRFDPPANGQRKPNLKQRGQVMRVTVFQCGPMANESERKAVEHLKHGLQSQPGDAEWVLLTNLAFSVTHQLQSDEIDIVAIGPPGVRVIEVKHWTASWVNDHRNEAEQFADGVTNKARKIGTTLRRSFSDLPYVDGVFLLTQESSKVKRLAGDTSRGVHFYPLNGWKDALGFDQPTVLSPRDVKRLSQVLEPRSPVAIDGSLRRLAGYVNLELQTPRDERFHRVYRGSHPTRRDRVVLHLYDLSATDDSNAEAKAKREFDALHRLQLHPWAPRILDSYQDAPGYAGEMFFFALVDPAAPSVAERATDATWATGHRIEFARRSVRALAELHQAGPADEPILHRQLSQRTLLVKYDNSPILTGFDRSKIPSDISVASSSLPAAADRGTAAPEVQAQGLAAADCRSDVYSLCASLAHLFHGRDDQTSRRTLEVLGCGMAEAPDKRWTLVKLDGELSAMLGESAPQPPAPPARFWTEDQIIPFREREYRIVNRLGSGGIGTAFKVVEIDHATRQELGTYVAKVGHDQEAGQRVVKAYSLARSYVSRRPALSTVLEVAREWRENNFVALMTWLEGTPLDEFMGVFPLLAEEQDEMSSEDLAVRWLRGICEGLDELHGNGLIHGDISPRNLIVSGSDLVLTDYDFVSRIGEPLSGPATVIYSSPSYPDQLPASPADDLYALAATFFHVIFDQEPFRYGGELEKKRGLNWDGLNRSHYPILSVFLDRATNPNPPQRFASVSDAIECLSPKSRERPLTPPAARTPEQGTAAVVPDRSIPQHVQVHMCEQRIPWLRSLLQSYPGSPRWGNRETRGLDTPFATDTYVTTALEETLIRDIRERQVRLVVLCGNAGDGKTALLQHLAARLGLGKHPSAQRILKGKLNDGLTVRINLDGSAAWKGRSADEILDEFLAPFQQGFPAEDIVHLLAINDGRLLEWIEGQETALANSLDALLQQEAATQASHIRFISLNQRSLVGGVSYDRTRIETDFLARLVDHLYGGENAWNIWSGCLTCSAKERCEVFRAAQLFGPDTLPVLAAPNIRVRARQRLFESLQAVHLRGETHITVRELRAALAYVLFGIHFCDDYHAVSDELSPPLPYWDRTFAAESYARQGEVLRQLARFDPALDAHPQIDRHLLSRPVSDSPVTAPYYEGLSLNSARRRAFFEWTEQDIEQITGDAESLDLARGRHLRLFRNLPLADQQTLDDICRRLCAGISRLEDLPPQAFRRPQVVPLRVTPRTPTETAFWVEKPVASFRLEADLPPETEGVESLHRQAFLIYRYRDGREESLRLGAELFHLLLELSEGYQLGDVSTGDTFAHLSVFVQRLVQEDARELMAFNPMQDDVIFRVKADLCETEQGPRQCLILAPVETGGGTMSNAKNATTARAIVDDVLGRAMTREIWTGNYDKALPVSVQDFDLGAVLPAVFYMFRFGQRRGKGKFLETFGTEGGTARERKRSATIDHVAADLTQTEWLRGFEGQTEHAILGDLLLCFCLENRNHALGRAEQIQRVAPAHYMASWIDLPEHVANLRYVPEMIVALLADQKNGNVVEQTKEDERTWFAVGQRFEDNVLLQAFHQGIRRDGQLADRAADRFQEVTEVGLDQLLTIRLAQRLGQAPDKLRGGEGERISNQRPIAELPSRHFSEDIRHFVRAYSGVIPRHAFVELLESCMAVGLTTIVTSVIELLFEWAATTRNYRAQATFTGSIVTLN